MIYTESLFLSNISFSCWHVSINLCIYLLSNDQQRLRLWLVWFSNKIRINIIQHFSNSTQFHLFFTKSQQNVHHGAFPHSFSSWWKQDINKLAVVSFHCFPLMSRWAGVLMSWFPWFMSRAAARSISAVLSEPSSNNQIFPPVGDADASKNRWKCSFHSLIPTSLPTLWIISSL